MAAVKPPSLFRGDTWRRSWRLQNSAGAPVDLTGAAARLHLRGSAGNLVIEATQANGRLTIDALAGAITLVVAAADTRDLPPARYPFDLEVTYAGGVVQTLEASVLNIKVDQTHD